MKKKEILKLVGESQGFYRNLSKQKGAGRPVLIRPELDEIETAAVVTILGLALGKEADAGSEAAADLHEKLRLIFGKVPKEQHEGLVLALAFGAELMHYARENPSGTTAKAWEKYNEMIQRNRKNAGPAGKLRGTCTDEEVITDFKEYKRRSPDNSYASAESFVAKKRDLESPRKLGERIQRITGTTPAKWYNSLP